MYFAVKAEKNSRNAEENALDARRAVEETNRKLSNIGALRDLASAVTRIDDLRGRIEHSAWDIAGERVSQLRAMMTAIVQSRTISLDEQHSDFAREFVVQMGLMSLEFDKAKMDDRAVRKVKWLQLLEDQKEGVIKLTTHLGDNFLEVGDAE